ncbi:MAG: 2-phosphosulfolactate phosphatase [Limisphaerales bacterium]
MRACANAETILAASFLNLTATAKFLQKNDFENILLVCAGTGKNKADEDILAAGALCELLDNSDLECGDVSPLSKAPTWSAHSNFFKLRTNSPADVVDSKAGLVGSNSPFRKCAAIAGDSRIAR